MILGGDGERRRPGPGTCLGGDRRSFVCDQEGVGRWGAGLRVRAGTEDMGGRAEGFDVETGSERLNPEGMGEGIDSLDERVGRFWSDGEKFEAFHEASYKHGRERDKRAIC